MDDKRYLVDVGMGNLPFPLRVASRRSAEGQFTIADISISARIMHEFEARWVDRFIQVLHSHRDRIGTAALAANATDYLTRLEASMVKVDFAYPYFVEKTTPASKEKCLVRYLCNFSVKASSIEKARRITFAIRVPVMTTYPQSDDVHQGDLFAQLSILTVETEVTKEIFPEDIVDIVDAHALMPVFSFLTEEDQNHVIHQLHSQRKTSVVTVDEVKEQLARNRDISWYSVNCTNYGMLHSYNTIIGTEKSMWVPFSGYGSDEI